MLHTNKIMRFIVFLTSIIVLSCSITENKEIKQVSSQRNAYLDNLPPYISAGFRQEDSLIFGYTKSTDEYDTSWTLLVSKSSRGIICKFTQLYPIGKSVFLTIEEALRNQRFEGRYMELEETKWSQILAQLNIVNRTPKDSTYYTGCFHCSRYSAFYNSTIFYSGELDKEFLAGIEGIIIRELGIP
ncbi:MAG TPA: hypothetical protein PLB49_09490 [Chitinophagaceae bacterium]|nr:hypothetical protein [Chitinophagaceae bacterium]HPH32074.1 hypothetical protein [Chitinophagaceae bacterium]